MQGLIRELRRREVFRTAGLYVGIAWIAIEAASVMLPAFEAPDWVLRALIIAAVVGFPISVVLAWVYDVTDKGIEVQRDATDAVVVPFGGRKMDFIVIGILSVALIFSVYMNITSGPDVVESQEPVSVLIADFVNETGDELFDGTLEQALQIGIESAPFVTGYRRDAALKLAASLGPAASLDLSAARLVAVREGVKLVMAGSIVENDGRYTLYVRAIDPKGGEVLTSAEVDAEDKLQVLSAVGELSGDLREELGDDSLDRKKLRISETFTAKSLEAAQAYAKAQTLQYNGKYEESVEYYEQAIAEDEHFGRAYSGLALSLGSLGRDDEADATWKIALQNLGSMTERERLRTLGLYYSRVTRNREKAIESYTSLIEKYPADDAAHNGLAIQHFYSLNFDAALEAGGKLLEIYPSSVMGRSNYALYAMYASDLDTAVAEAAKVRELDSDYFKAWLPVAIKALADNDTAAALQAYENMAAVGGRGASTASLGRADIAMFEDDHDTAKAELRDGIAADEASGSRYYAATKYIALAQAEMATGDVAAALNAITQGLELSSRDAQNVPAALVYIAAGEYDRASEIAAALSAQLQPTSRAYGMMIDGLVLLEQGEQVPAIDQLTAALNLADLWLVRYFRGRAYLNAGFAAEAMDEFSACIERKGEAAAIFLDDLPTYRYMADVPEWLGRARDGLGMQ